jgi:hypothetical protein
MDAAHVGVEATTLDQELLDRQRRASSLASPVSFSAEPFGDRFSVGPTSTG